MADSELVLLGEFSPSEAARLFKRFEEEGIKCCCERDDTALHQLSAERLLGSSFGSAVAMRVFVDAHNLQRCEQLQKELFGEGQV